MFAMFPKLLEAVVMSGVCSFAPSSPEGLPLASPSSLGIVEDLLLVLNWLLRLRPCLLNLRFRSPMAPQFGVSVVIYGTKTCDEQDARLIDERRGFVAGRIEPSAKQRASFQDKVYGRLAAAERSWVAVRETMTGPPRLFLAMGCHGN